MRNGRLVYLTKLDREAAVKSNHKSKTFFVFFKG